MTERGIPAGRHGEEEITADASWLEHVERVRESGRRYRPASHGNRPSLTERPTAPGKVRRTPEQLKLDLKAAHLSCFRKRLALGKYRAPSEPMP